MIDSYEHSVVTVDCQRRGMYTSKDTANRTWHFHGIEEELNLHVNAGWEHYQTVIVENARQMLGNDGQYGDSAVMLFFRKVKQL